MRVLDERARLTLVGDVDLAHDRGRLDALGEYLEPLLTARSERHRGARGGQRQRSGLADPGRRSGDGGHATLERTRHGSGS